MPIKLNREIILKSDAKYGIIIFASDFFAYFTLGKMMYCTVRTAIMRLRGHTGFKNGKEKQKTQEEILCFKTYKYGS